MQINNSYYNKSRVGGYNQQNQQTDKTDGRRFFANLSGFRSISFEGKNLLLENESYINILAFSLIILGFVPFASLFDKQKVSVFLIFGGLLISLISFFICSKFRSISVINFFNNSFYKEFRLDSFTIPINFSEIKQIGLDHKSERSLTKGFNSGLLLWFFYYIQGKKLVPVKESNMINGNVEKTAVVFLTKEGKKIAFNNYSDKIDSDDTLLLLAETLSSYTKLPLKVAKEYEELIVNNNNFVINKISTSKEVMRSFYFGVSMVILFLLGLFIIVKFVD